MGGGSKLGRPALQRGVCACGKPLPRTNSTCCSRECQAIALSFSRDKRQSRSCEECGMGFKVKACRLQPGKPPVRFCSKVCHSASLRKRHDFVCCKCGDQKTEDDFFVDNNNPRGHVARCKSCYAENVNKVIRFQPAHRQRTIKADAAKRDRSYTLTQDQFMSFWQKPCVYCGDPIATIGLDRIDNSKGYEMGNIVPCCKVCNGMKSDQTFDDFMDRCARISSRNQVDANSAITHGGKY